MAAFRSPFTSVGFDELILDRRNRFSRRKKTLLFVTTEREGFIPWRRLLIRAVAERKWNNLRIDSNISSGEKKKRDTLGSVDKWDLSSGWQGNLTNVRIFSSFFLCFDEQIEWRLTFHRSMSLMVLVSERNGHGFIYLYIYIYTLSHKIIIII